MVTKRSKGYVPYLYTWKKYKSITAYIKKRGKELSTLNIFTKNKQNKKRLKKKNERKEESYLNYTTIIKYAFCFIFFSSDKLAKHASKNVFVLFSSSNLLLVCLLQS